MGDVSWATLPAPLSNNTLLLAHKVLVLLEARVSMGRQHLPMCVHVDALALCLLEKHIQVMHVMPCHQDALPRHWIQWDLGGDGGTKPVRRW